MSGTNCSVALMLNEYFFTVVFSCYALLDVGELPLGGNGSSAENSSCCVSCHLPSGFNFKSIICE